MGSGASLVVKLLPTGREFAMMIGKGILCAWNDGICGMSDHNWPAPWPVSFVKKFSRDVWLRKWYEIMRAHGSVREVSLFNATFNAR